MHLFNAVGFVAVVTIGCSDDASSTRGAGGGTNSGGVATSRGGAAPGSSGAEQGGHVQTGGVAGQGGASGSTLAGGSTTVAGGTSGSGTTDVSGCPQWPRASVLPLVGPFFYGPDPGPCGTTSTSMSGTESTIYEYQGALLLSSVTSTRTRNYTWSGGLLAGYTLNHPLISQ